MENAARALEIAAGVLIGVLLMALIVYFFKTMGEWPQQQDDMMSSEQTSKFNLEYEVYGKKGMYGVDVISCLNKAKDNNDKYLDERGDISASNWDGNQNLEGALLEGVTVCAGFSKALCYLLNKVGIECKFVAGKCNSEDSEDHAWNLVNIDGELYYVDSTILDLSKIMEKVLVLDGDEEKYEINYVDVEEYIKEGYGSLIEWYMEDTSKDHLEAIDPDGIHVPTNDFNYMDNIALSQENMYLFNSGDKKIPVFIDGKLFFVSLGALISVLSVIGVAKKVNSKDNYIFKDEEQINSRLR